MAKNDTQAKSGIWYHFSCITYEEWYWVSFFAHQIWYYVFIVANFANQQNDINMKTCTDMEIPIFL